MNIWNAFKFGDIATIERGVHKGKRGIVRRIAPGNMLYIKLDDGKTIIRHFHGVKNETTTN